jgi:hypothetical protein
MDRYYGNEWGRKGATISDKTARLEYGLTQDEIYDAIDAGKLQYRPAAMHGNPWLRLLRREVEDLARTLHGDRDVREKQARAEMAQPRAQTAPLPARRPRGKARRTPFRARREMTPANRVDECRSARTHHERLGIRRNRRLIPPPSQTAAAPGLPHHCQGRLRARRHGEARPAAQASVLPPSLTACR